MALLTIIQALGVPCVTFVQIQLSSLRYEIDDFGGCVTTYANPIAIGSYILLVIYETFIAVLSLVKAAQQRTTSSWVVRLYTESFIFYVYILGMPVVLNAFLSSSQDNSGLLNQLNYAHR
ncbi:hypothetical protein BDZ89DRAFT_1152734 [Hymenopellis radicata]|nr:hypothetical protein BDZ89DRAFT_1152734 [Hymenopellis radicata]